MVIVLASGRGERFAASGGSGHKLDALLGGKSVLQHTLDAVRDSGMPWHLERGDHAGMGDSIAAAVRKTSAASGWLILPGDLPLVQGATLRLVSEALKRHDVAVPSYQGKRGHPVGFSASCLQALLGLSGDRGAFSVIRSHAAVEIDVDDMGCVMDIDTEEDLRLAQEILRRCEPSPANL